MQSLNSEPWRSRPLSRKSVTDLIEQYTNTVQIGRRLKYLGTPIKKANSLEKEIKSRINNVHKCYFVLITIFKAMNITRNLDTG